MMLSRRNVIRNLSAIPFIGGLLNIKKMADFQTPDNGYHRDYFKELGVRTFINAAGTYTALTSSLMTEEVKNAYLYASTQFVNLNELHDTNRLHYERFVLSHFGHRTGAP